MIRRAICAVVLWAMRPTRQEIEASMAALMRAIREASDDATAIPIEREGQRPTIH